MTFSNPHGLWLFVLAAPLIALYFFKTRLKSYRVPFLPLWEESAAQQVRWGLRVLREAVSLLLLLAVLSGLTLGLAGVEVTAWAHTPVHYVIVIDDSASMEGRLAEAKAVVRDVLKRLYRKDRVTLMSPGGQQNLDAMRPVRGVHVGTFLETLARKRPEGELWIVSDESEPIPAGLAKRRRVGRAEENLGITAIDVARPADRWAAVCRVKITNAGSETRQALGTTIEPGQGVWVEIQPGEVRLPGDALAADNVVRIDAPDATPPPVILFHEGKPNAFVAAVLKAMQERGEIDRDTSYATTIDKLAETEFADRTVMILDGGRLDAWPVVGRYLYMGTEGPGAGEFIRAPEVAWWDAETPVHRLIDLSRLHLKQARPVHVNGGSTSILGTERESLAILHVEPDLRFLRLGFRLDDSNFPLLAAFPIFLRNAIRWLSENPAPAARRENLLDPIETDLNAKGPRDDAPLPVAPRWWQDLPHPAVAFFAAALLLLVELALARRL